VNFTSMAHSDPLLPKVEPLAIGEPLLSVPGAHGVYRRRAVDLDSPEAEESAADQHVLDARLTGSDRAAAMSELLDRFDERIGLVGPDSEALVNWPSRDTELTSTFLAHGLVPHLVWAARPAGRPTPVAAGSVAVRSLRDTDLEFAVDLQLELARWNTQFGGRPPRPATEAHSRRVLSGRLARELPWAWVAQDAGLLVVAPPEQTGWLAPMVSTGPVAYLGSMVVGAGRRGDGVGSALVRAAHDALDAAGVRVTLLHYYAMNPLSVPFWHRCGYRPLWTSWVRRPARRTA